MEWPWIPGIPHSFLLAPLDPQPLVYAHAPNFQVGDKCEGCGSHGRCLGPVAYLHALHFVSLGPLRLPAEKQGWLEADLAAR